MGNKSSNENDDNGNGTSCPPGMIPDPDNPGKCISKGGNEKRKRTEEDNAGDSTAHGTQAGETPNDKPDTNPHNCPEGSHWNGDECVPNGPPAGTPAGSEDPSVPGKEGLNAEELSNILGQYAGFMQSMAENMMKSQEKTTDTLAKYLGVPQHTVESIAFGGQMKAEASSKVDDSPAGRVYKESVADPANWMWGIKKGSSGLPNSIEWSIKPEAYYKTLRRITTNYGTGKSTPVVNDKGDMASRGMSAEAFTISGGDMPQVFSKQVYLIPGGRMRVPIRQFLDVQIIEDADRYNWYTVTGFLFDDTTAEGSEPSNEAQTVAKVTATPSLKRAVQTVKYSDIENAPFDLIEAFNRAAALGALHAEAVEVLDTTYDAITPTNWVNGNSGAALTDDDVASMTLKQEGVYAAKRLIETQGGDTSPGQLVLFAHPKAVEELILDTAADFFTGQGALHSTALGVLENRLGVDIVVTNAVAAQDNTTNDTYRNILAIKGSIGLAVAADLQIEAQRRPDLSAVKVGARHRIKGAVIDETMTCRISTAQ